MTYAPNQRSDQDQAFLAHQIGDLVDQTVKAKAISAHISTPFGTSRPAVDFPLFTTPVSTGFIAELDDLPLSNADTSHVTVTAYKIAGATQASSEMLADLDPDIAAQIGGSIADQIIWNLDSSVLGSTTANGPSGLLSLGSTVVRAGTSLTNTDAFVKAVYAAQNAAVTANVTHFVVSPATAQSLSLIKTFTGSDNSNQSLLQFQQDGTILVAGVPILISKLVDTATIGWAVDASHSRLVLRQGTQVVKTYIPQNDSWFISGVARYGWGNLAPASVVRILADSRTWTVTETGSPTAGTFTLKVNGVETAAIAKAAGGSDVEAALIAAGVPAADVSSTGSAGGPFTVTGPFSLALGTNSLTGGTSPTVTVVAA